MGFIDIMLISKLRLDFIVMNKDSAYIIELSAIVCLKLALTAGNLFCNNKIWNFFENTQVDETALCAVILITNCSFNYTAVLQTAV